MSRTPLLLLGAGGHARACIDVIEQEGRYAISGLLGSASEMGQRICGYVVLGTDAALRDALGAARHALVAVGQIKSPDLRMRLHAMLFEAGCQLPVIVSPRAYVSRHAELGAGTIVMHGAIVNAGARVGSNCILNSQSLIEHDALIEDHCHIATGAIINSGVRVGAGTFIGSQASVRQGVRIGGRCVIGLGQSLVRDCVPGTWVPDIKRSE